MAALHRGKLAVKNLWLRADALSHSVLPLGMALSALWGVGCGPDWSGAAQSRLVAYPEALDFGHVAAGALDRPTEQIELRNEGEELVWVEALGLVDGETGPFQLVDEAVVEPPFPLLAGRPWPCRYTSNRTPLGATETVSWSPPATVLPWR